MCIRQIAYGYKAAGTDESVWKYRIFKVHPALEAGIYKACRMVISHQNMPENNRSINGKVPLKNLCFAQKKSKCSLGFYSIHTGPDRIQPFEQKPKLVLRYANSFFRRAGPVQGTFFKSLI